MGTQLGYLLGVGVDVVIPAHDEAATIGAVVAAARASVVTRRTVVVADACTDGTAMAAASAGAMVITIDAGDKGSAMAAGLAAVATEYVCFVDADLEGLAPAHIESLVNVAQSRGAMAVGVRAGDRLSHVTLTLTALPPIGGERALPTIVARATDLEGAGYASEMLLAKACALYGVPIVDVPLSGLHHAGEGINVAAHARRWVGVARGLMSSGGVTR